MVIWMGSVLASVHVLSKSLLRRVLQLQREIIMIWKEVAYVACITYFLVAHKTWQQIHSDPLEWWPRTCSQSLKTTKIKEFKPRGKITQVTNIKLQTAVYQEHKNFIAGNLKKVKCAYNLMTSVSIRRLPALGEDIFHALNSSLSRKF